jgi:very-short-patch-repair endonuclease
MVKLQGRKKYPIYFGASPKMLKIAGDLRKLMTPAEKILWEHLRNKQLLGFRFRRHHPIGELVVDFFCYERMLAIEIDGAVHDTPIRRKGIRKDQLF